LPGASGTASAGQLPASVVYNNQANTYSSGLQDFSTASVKLPKGAGLTETVNAQVGYDTTANNLHAGINGADKVIPTVTPGTPVNGDCPFYVVSGNNVQFGDQPCSAGSGNVNQTGTAALGDVPEYNLTSGQGINDPQLLQLLQGPPNNWQQGPAHYADDLVVRPSPAPSSTGSTKESSLKLQGTDVGSGASGGGNVGGDVMASGGDCGLTLSGANSCQGGNLHLVPGGHIGALTAGVNNPIPGYGGTFTSWRKGNSGNLTIANNGRLLCGDGVDTQGNTNHNTADICGNVVGDYSAPIGFFVFSSSGRFVNPNGEKLAVQVSGSISGVQTCPLTGGCSGESWGVNAPVCTDPAHPGYVTSPSSNHCFCPSKRVGTSRISEGAPLTLHTMEIHLGDACDPQLEVNTTNLTQQSPVSFNDGNGIHISAAGLGSMQFAITSPTVANNQANTYSGGGTQDFGSVAIRLPKQNGGSFSTADGAMEYDTSMYRKNKKSALMKSLPGKP
jgi:hypothetical protein